MAAVLATLVAIAGAAPATHAAYEQPLSPTARLGWNQAPDLPLAVSGATTSVNAIAQMGDTTWFGGSFDQVGPREGHFVVHGVDPFDATRPANTPQQQWPEVHGGEVHAVEYDKAGGWWVGGKEFSAAGYSRIHLAHFRADGTVRAWRLGRSTGEPIVHAIEPLGTGDDAYVGGEFNDLRELIAGGALGAPTPANGLASILGGSVGALTSLPNPAATVWDIHTTGTSPNRVLWLAGGNLGPVATPASLLRVDFEDGTSLPTYAPAGTGLSLGYAKRVLDGTGNAMLVGGAFGVGPNLVAIADDGTQVPAATLSFTIDGAVTDLHTRDVGATAPDEIYVAGGYNNLGVRSTGDTGAQSVAVHALARIRRDAGTGRMRVDPAWKPFPTTTGSAVDMAFDPATQRLHVAGTFDDAPGAQGKYLRSFAVDNLADVWFGQASKPVISISRDPDTGTFAYGGTFEVVGGVRARNLVGYNATTREFVVPTAFPKEAVQALAVAGGRLFVGGTFTSVDNPNGTVAGTGQRQLLRYTAAGAFEAVAAPVPGSQTTATIKAMAATPGGGLYVASSPCTSNPTCSAIVRYDTPAGGGTLAGTQVGTASGGTVAALAVDPADQALVVGGSFTGLGTGGALPAAGIANAGRLNTAPATVASIPAITAPVKSLATNGGTLFAGLSAAPWLQALNAGGAVAFSGTDRGINGPVDALAATPSGDAVYAGGTFGTAAGTVPNKLVRLEAPNYTATAWTPGIVDGPGVGVKAIGATDATVAAGGYLAFGVQESNSHLATWKVNRRPVAASPVLRTHAADVVGSTSTGARASATPTLRFTVSDPEDAQVRWRVRIWDVAAPATPVLTYTSPLAATGLASYTVGAGPAVGTYGHGTAATVLQDGHQYSWDVTAFDPVGADSAPVRWAGAGGTLLVDAAQPTATLSVPDPLGTGWLRGAISLSGTVGDSSPVSQVRLLQAGAAVCTPTPVATPTALEWSCPGLVFAEGTHSVGVETTDALGNTGPGTSAATVRIDNTAPYFSALALTPAVGSIPTHRATDNTLWYDGSSPTGFDVTVGAPVSDPGTGGSGILDVQFGDLGPGTGTVDATPPYEHTYSVVPGTSALVSVVARDMAGNLEPGGAETHGQFAIRPDGDDPLPQFDSGVPADGATASGTVAIGVGGADTGSGVSSLLLEVAEAGITFPVTGDAGIRNWDTTFFADGPYTLELTARDRVGREATITRTVTVDNVPDVVPPPPPAPTPPPSTTPVPTPPAAPQPAPTPIPPPLPATPAELMASARTVGGVPKLSLIWRAASATPVDHYEVQLVVAGSGTPGADDTILAAGTTRLDVVAEALSATLAPIRLQPGATYDVTVRAVDAAGLRSLESQHLSVHLPRIATELVTFQSDDERRLRACGWLANKCAYSGGTLRVSGGFTPPAAAAGRDVTVQLYRKTSDGGYDLVDRLPSVSGASFEVQVALGDLKPGAYRLDAAVAASDRADGATSSEHFFVAPA